MTTVEIPVGRDGFVTQVNPTTWYGNSPYLLLRGAGSSEQRRSMLWFPDPVPAGANVVEALLRLGIRDTAFTGQTLLARLITQSWASPTWNKQPTTDAAGEISEAITAAVGAQVELDVTTHLAAVAAGTPWYGIRLALTEDVLRRLHSKESAELQPLLVVTYTLTPVTPTDPRPSENRAVSVARPTVTWGLLGPGAQADAQVQVSEAEDFLVNVWDSGTVATTDQQMQVGTDLTLGGTYWWRVRVRDASGVWSDWSTPAQFRRIAKAVLTITSPVNGGTVETSTPAIVHTFVGQTQRAVEREVLESGVEVAEDPLHAGVDTTWEVPAGALTQESVDVVAIVRVHDDVDREATPGDPPYVEALTTFQFVRAAAGPPTDLVISSGDSPIATLQWQRAAAPAFFVVRRDGILVSDRLVPGDVLVGGTTYEWRDFGARPGTEHTYEVAAVINDGGVYKESAGNPSEANTVQIKGKWLLSEELDLDVVIIGHADDEDRDAESAETIMRPGTYAVRVSDGAQGRVGQLRGMLLDSDAGGVARTADQWRERLRAIKQASDIRLVMGTDNIPVLLGELQMPLSPPADPVEYSLNVDFWQNDDA